MVNQQMKRGGLRTLLLAFLLGLTLLQGCLSGGCGGTLVPQPGPPGSPSSEVPKQIFGTYDYAQHSASVNVYAGYSAEPAPMGIADYGVGPSGAYQYSTNSSLGIAYITSLLTKNSTGDMEMGIQLNVNLVFADNNKQYVYWVQDVADINSGTGAIAFVDNIWNSTVRQGSMSGSAVSGSGTVDHVGTQYYYYDVAGASLPGNKIFLTYPVYVNFEMNVTTNSLQQPQVKFAYNDGHGWVTYDTVTFSSVRRLTSLSGFVVNGFNYKPDGAFYDSELILGGAGGGLSTTAVQSDVRLKLEYWNGHNYQPVATAYNFGSDTAEAVDNVFSQGYYYPDNGTIFGWVTPGSGTLRELYDPSQLSIVEVRSPLASGVLSIRAPLRTNPKPAQYPFSNGDVTVVLQPGYYELDVYSGSSLFSAGNFSLVQGQSLHLQTPLGPVRLTLSYSAIGGGAGYSGPTFTYRYNNVVQSATLGTSPATYTVDPGSTWSVSYLLPGSSASERWATNQTATGSASGALSLQFSYRHQYLATVSFALVGGGTVTPVFSSRAFGSLVTQTVALSPAGVWVDSGAQYSISSPISGANPDERWQASEPTSGTITSATTISPKYYHQYGYSLSYTVVGGGSPAAPSLTYSSAGSQSSATFSSAAVTAWLDSGSAYSFTATLGGSSNNERWQTDAATAGTASGQGSLSPVYHHQYLISAAYAVAGGGVPPAPVFSYNLFGARTSTLAANQSQSFWADGGPYSATNPLAGPSSSERWYAAAANGTVLSPGVVTIAYRHQFYLAVRGGDVPSKWYDSGTDAAITPETTFGRSLGVGLRLVGYSLDGGQAVTIPAGPRTFSIDVTMDSAHTLAFANVTQYEVTLDSTAKGALRTVTPSTVSGDDYWYDAGSSVKVVLNGTWGRGTGTGSRLVSYLVNGGSQVSVASGGAVTVLSVAFITAPQSISANADVQFQLTTPSGSVSSATPPPISGDTGWYDSGTSVRLLYSYAWNVTTGQSRLNAIGYDVDGSQRTTLPRSGNGTFAVSVTMDSTHRVNVAGVTQYYLSVSGGSARQTTVPSPTGDGFYDSGSSTSVSSNYIWNLVPNTSREALTGYTLDGSMTNISRAESGVFTASSLTFDRHHTLAFNSVVQYFVTFRFTDSSGRTQIVPTSLQLDFNGRVENVPGFGAWLDRGTTFRPASVVWEGVDVKPAGPTSFSAEGAGQETIHARVYGVSLRVTDLLGLPVSGAKASIALVNGTTITKTTGGGGAVEIPLVPLGRYNATVSFLGGSTVIRGDASLSAVGRGQLALSYPDIALPGALVIVAVLVFLLLRRRRFSLRRLVRRRRWPTSGWDIRRRSLRLHS